MFFMESTERMRKSFIYCADEAMLWVQQELTISKLKQNKVFDNTVATNSLLYIGFGQTEVCI